MSKRNKNVDGSNRNLERSKSNEPGKEIARDRIGEKARKGIVESADRLIIEHAKALHWLKDK